MTHEELFKKALEDVKKYDPNPDEELLRELVAIYAIVFRNADSAYVACGQRDELERVKKNFLLNKLHVDLSDEEMDRLLKEVCEEIKGRKLRSTFYYLLTKKLGRRDAFV